MNCLFDNIVWHALAGPQAKYSLGTDAIRRYAPGFSPIIGFANPEHPNFATITSFCEPSEHFYCDAWSGSNSDGWRIEKEAVMLNDDLAGRYARRG